MRSRQMARMSESPIHRTFNELGHNAILYRYPSGDMDIICSSSGGFGLDGWEESDGRSQQQTKPAKREKGKKSDGEDMVRSMRRAKANLRRLALANSFDFFVTLTFDPKKVDSFSADAVSKALNGWLSNMVRRRELRYVLVPELHPKSGRIHLHGFFSGELDLVDSGHTSCGKPVYNLPQWGYGFSTALEIDGDYSAAVGYICKYIGKDTQQRIMGRWYYSGGRLEKPVKEYIDLDYREAVDDWCFIGPLEKGQKWQGMVADIPGSKLLIIHTKQEEKP